MNAIWVVGRRKKKHEGLGSAGARGAQVFLRKQPGRYQEVSDGAVCSLHEHLPALHAQRLRLLWLLHLPSAEGQGTRGHRRLRLDRRDGRAEPGYLHAGVGHRSEEVSGLHPGRKLPEHVRPLRGLFFRAMVAWAMVAWAMAALSFGGGQSEIHPAAVPRSTSDDSPPHTCGGYRRSPDVSTAHVHFED